MLVNVRSNFDPTMAMINAMMSGGVKDENPEVGIYKCAHFNFGNTIAGPKDEWADLDQYGDYLGSYGVCDTIEQWKQHYAKLIEDPDRKFCVSFCEVKKSEQESQGGWRWHKWGEYIGDKNPQHEYIYDEDDSIQSVFCFHVYEIGVEHQYFKNDR